MKNMADRHEPSFRSVSEPRVSLGGEQLQLSFAGTRVAVHTPLSAAKHLELARVSPPVPTGSVN